MLELLATDKQLTNLIVIFCLFIPNKMKTDENSWIFDELNFQEMPFLCVSSLRFVWVILNIRWG